MMCTLPNLTYPSQMVLAVIFDCDGVLVDNEVVIHAIELEVLAEFGLSFDSPSFKRRFMGLSDAAYYAAIDAEAETRLGKCIQDQFRPRLSARLTQALATELREVPGARLAVAATRKARAVASSSGRASLAHKLKRLDLWELFAPHIYSGEHVAHAKPAPDLFPLNSEGTGHRSRELSRYRRHC